jgi:hypothetical protein
VACFFRLGAAAGKSISAAVSNKERKKDIDQVVAPFNT